MDPNLWPPSKSRMTMNCVFSCHCQGLSPMNVRYLYAAIFLQLANLSAWFARENTVSYYLKQRLSGACQGDRGCLAAESVLVASHAFFLFFMAMFFSTVRTGKVNELRNLWHCGWWPVKIALFMVYFLVSVLAPSWWIQIYEKITQLGAGIFLVVQLISFMRFITRLNYKLCQTNYQGRYLVVFGISIFANIGSTGLIIFMIVKLRHYWLDIEFLGTTLVLVYIMCALSLISKANKLFMEPGIICGYILFLLPVSDYK
uniref:Serinc-domain containing serine and sphingolipid biosynthesis protein n=1 Tax=Zea mays TaxID=4577 RepID=C4J6G1_MAIZE|nr:unknown [Zea mays]|eukprot:NP_001183431.1 uncharacterized protein LOC100501855 [Zea mays]